MLNIDDRINDDKEMEVIHQSPYFDDEHLIKCQQNNHNSFLIYLVSIAKVWMQNLMRLKYK